MNEKIRIYIEDATYTKWSFIDAETNAEIGTETFPALEKVIPADHGLFSRDVFEIVKEDPLELRILHSNITLPTTVLAGVLVLSDHRTYGRTENKKRLLYKCIPDDLHLPVFLVPYDVSLKFSKVMVNKYVTFRYDNWTTLSGTANHTTSLSGTANHTSTTMQGPANHTNTTMSGSAIRLTHPRGQLVETIGDVTDLSSFYEYQLYCKSLHVSLTQFNKSAIHALKEKKHEEYIDQIFNNPDYTIEDHRDRTVFTIDPPNSVDFDDGFSIQELENGHKMVFVYIANVFVWLEALNLWDSFSQRVSTIYLPDRRRPMLPTILSDALCSLQEGQLRFAVVFSFVIDPATGQVIGLPENRCALINVAKNYRYEERALLVNDEFGKLLALSHKMDKTNKNSHDVVTFWMVLVNKHCGKFLASEKTGIFRSSYFIHPMATSTSDEQNCLSEDTCRVIRSWNNTIGQYVAYTEDNASLLDHEMMSIKSFKPRESAKQEEVTHCYIHITSPIRRLVDLLNQMMFFVSSKLVTSMSTPAANFLDAWLTKPKIDYINTAMRSIRKIQIDCDILARCYTSPNIMTCSHDGALFDRIVRNDGMVSYMVYLEKLKILTRITVSQDLNLSVYKVYPFKLFLFEDESKVKRKIRLQVVSE
uniref:RNB domain-containing protein n=1 Tax=viral metagenome TaxID=1070528 RepID=A0A6C0I544_9ZZZZ